MSPKSTEWIIGFLEQAPVFSVARSEILDDLAQAACCKSLFDGELLFTQMEPADHVYVVISGCVALFLATEDGKELVINEMHPGDCFGELSLITDKPRSTGAMAREASEILSIPNEEFLAALGADAALMRSVLETTASRLRVSSERESALAFLDSESRVAKTLLDLDKRAGKEGFIRITQETLGQYVGLTRQTVARTLGVWRRDGWVITARGGIRILNRAALEKMVRETNPENG
jgi:CRP/FNR family transcriptional regulator